MEWSLEEALWRAIWGRPRAHSPLCPTGTAGNWGDHVFTNCICPFVHESPCGFVLRGLTLTNYYISLSIHPPSLFCIPPTSIHSSSSSSSLLVTPSWWAINVWLCVLPPEREGEKGGKNWQKPCLINAGSGSWTLACCKHTHASTDFHTRTGMCMRTIMIASIWSNSYWIYLS